MTMSEQPEGADVMSGGAPDVAIDDAAVTDLDLRGSLEALLIVVDEPTPVAQLAALVERTVPEVLAELNDLAATYLNEGRGFELRETGAGWRLYSSASFAPVVERYVLDGQQARLTQASLETLAVVAYKQPVSRGRVSAVRGVNCDGVMRTLATRGLIEEAGVESGSGASLYRTSQYFLERMGLDSVADLPDIAPYLPDLDSLDDLSSEGLRGLDDVG
jgi:segregation and condensation protein B